MKYVKVFIEMEKVFWHRVFFKKRLMILFEFGFPALFLFTSSFPVFSWWWWGEFAIIAFAFWVMLPVILGAMSTKSNPLYPTQENGN